MNIKIPSVLIGCALLSTITLAQTVTPDSTKSGAPAVTISGGGNKGLLTKFAVPSQINDSNVFQSNEGASLPIALMRFQFSLRTGGGIHWIHS